MLARLGPVVLVVDVPKSTAYAAMHMLPYALDLMSDAHALSRRVMRQK